MSPLHPIIFSNTSETIMAKTKSERNKEERLRRIERHGMDCERERKARTRCYVPVNQLTPRQLKARRKRKNDSLKKWRAKKKQENINPAEV